MPSLDSYLQEYAQKSASARAELRCILDVRYGPTPCEKLDLFLTSSVGSPLHVFVHGGNWCAVSKESSAFPAPAFLREGISFAAIDYGLAPAVRLEEMVAMVRRAVCWLLDNAERFGCDPTRIYLSGASAGAHLAALAAFEESRRKSPRQLAGLVLMSGIYDLEPVRRSYVNEVLMLDRRTARRLSPLWLVRRLSSHALPHVLLARGGNETQEFIRQQEIMSHALSAARVPMQSIVCAARNHFDLTYDLCSRGTLLGDSVLHQMSLLRSTPAATE